jgi:putative ATP-dependent endonuclease of OLD family
LRDLDPAIGTIRQLQAIRTQVRERMARFVGIAEGDDATGFFASELTRENLREFVTFLSDRSRAIILFLFIG